MPRVSRGMPRTGPRSERERPLVARAYSQVDRRTRRGERCEWCGVEGERLEHAHVFGRPATGLRLGTWAHHPLLVRGLCCDNPATGRLGCHQDIDIRDPEKRWEVRSWCVTEFRDQVFYGRDVPEGYTPDEAMVYMVTALEKAGVTHG